MSEMAPPLIGFLLRESSAGHRPDNMSAQQKLEEIVCDGDSAQETEMSVHPIRIVRFWRST